MFSHHNDDGGTMVKQWGPCYWVHASSDYYYSDLCTSHGCAVTSRGNGQPLLLLIPPSSLPYEYIAWIKPELHAQTL